MNDTVHVSRRPPSTGYDTSEDGARHVGGGFMISLVVISLSQRACVLFACALFLAFFNCQICLDLESVHIGFQCVLGRLALDLIV